MAQERHHAFRLDHTAPPSHLPTRQCHCAECGQHHPRHRPPLHRRRQQGKGLKKARRTFNEVQRDLPNIERQRQCHLIHRITHDKVHENYHLDAVELN